VWEARAIFAKPPLGQIKIDLCKSKHNTTPMAYDSVLIQLRMGHVPLNNHLFKISKVDSSTVCRGEDNSVHHYLFRCPVRVYKKQRQ
jgi:hypothetical protein